MRKRENKKKKKKKEKSILVNGAFDINETSIGIEINGEIFFEITIYSYLLKNLKEKKIFSIRSIFCF